MSEKIRKYLLPNMPYLFGLWFCLKLGTAYRLAVGANIGLKLIGMMGTIGLAFETIAPGFHAADWLIGIAVAALLRFIIYRKVKNAKKFRRYVEYGSARWGVEY
jgi:type IV secretion system protein VirD4